jgi:2-dehydro-3-deoxyphosphogluconate aldolase/(4S)-4-hydroxy-2-oxoglutarate aldolase
MTDPLAAIADQRVLPVVTIDDAGTARELGRALRSAGATAVEITFRSEAAADAIAALAGDGFVVGAGTVLSAQQVQIAAAAGAVFAVSPGLDQSVVQACAEFDLIALPGVATASELTQAMSLGISTVKLFPAEVVGGVALIKALAAPFPNACFVPTGGLTAENAGSYLALPQVLAIGGSWMTAPSLLAAADWDSVERLTREAIGLGRSP